jgi:hypothetical protein
VCTDEVLVVSLSESILGLNSDEREGNEGHEEREGALLDVR